MLGFDGVYPADHPKTNFDICAEKSRKVGRKTFHKINILFNFVNLSAILCPLYEVEVLNRPNPGPKPNSCQSFSLCHWNLNSISAQNFIKLSLLKPYIAIHKFDVVCLSETYLNASISNDDDSLEVPGYNLFRADHPILNAEVFVFIMEILFP